MATIFDEVPPPRISDVESSQDNPRISISEAAPQTRVYPIRWYYVFVCCMLHICWNFSFLTYAPVANYSDKYYGKGTATATSLIFMAVSTVICPFEMYFSRRMGLRWVIIVGLLSMTLGTGVRCISLFDLSMKSKSTVVKIGQAVAAVGGPFSMFVPTKLAAAWFPARQRALATSLISVSGPGGILLINLLAPAIVKSKDDMVGLNLMVFVLCILSSAMALVGIRRSLPEIPPSKSAFSTPMPFFAGLKRCLTSLPFLILIVCLGGGLGLFNCLYSTMEQFLCVKGYSNQFIGGCIVGLIAGGISFATIAGIVADRTKLFVEILKVVLPLAVIFGIGFTLLAKFPDMQALLVFCALFFGGFGTTFYAIGLEMSAECTYPVEETTTAGILGMSGNLQGVIYVLLFKSLALPLKGSDLDTQVCGLDEDGKSVGFDARISLLVFAGIGVIQVLIFVPFFSPQYKRMTLERENEDERGIDD